MRLLVCGGRNFKDEAFAFTILDRCHAKRPISLLIHGAASGADTLGDQWAKSRGVPVLSFPADWSDLMAPGAILRTRRDGSRYNAKAGADRNRRMLEEGRPDGVLALPGGNGTRDMVAISKQAGLVVWEPRIAGWVR